MQSQLGITLRVGDAYRSIDLQNSIYEEGRSKPGTIKTRAKGGKSYHNYGLAIDVYFSENGVTNVNKVITPEVADIGKSLGFEWGGDWAEGTDNPHFEMSFGSSVGSLYKNYLKSK